MLYFKKGTFVVKNFESQHPTSNFLHCKIDPLAIFHIYLVHFSTSTYSMLFMLASDPCPDYFLDSLIEIFTTG